VVNVGDPTVYLNNVPIGVANADKGAIDGGEEANFGTDVVEGLKAEPYLNIIETTPEEALEGLRTDKYLFNYDHSGRLQLRTSLLLLIRNHSKPRSPSP